MIHPEAILRFADQQKKLLRKTYDEAWLQGVHSYIPDDDPDKEPSLPRDMAVAGLSGSPLLNVRRQYKYQAPNHPSAVYRAVALAPAFIGIASMVGEIVSIMDAASPYVESANGDISLALTNWTETNSWRLDNGDSVAWAGEQAGYAEAADADGQYLYGWMTVGDNRVCSGCELLSSFPPMPLGMWPTAPGAGDTDCGPGCRCSWDVWGDPLPVDYVPYLTSDQQALSDQLATQQAQTITDLMPDAVYLEG